MKAIDFSYFIERYNAGEMSEAEKPWFQKELDGNEKLREEVNLRKRADEVLKNQNLISLRNKLSEIEGKRREANVHVRNSKNHNSLKYAAVIAGLVLVGSITMFSGKNGKNLSSDEISDKIINQYYKAYELPAPQRSGQSEIISDFTQAQDFYNERDFRTAEIFLKKTIISDPGDMKSQLLYGVAKFENKKYPEAKQSFVNVINNGKNLFTETAEWYLAMCYVKTDEKEKAIQLLKNIRSESSIHRNDAKKIIRKLK